MSNPINKLSEMLSNAGISHVKKQAARPNINEHTNERDKWLMNHIFYPDTYESNRCKFDCCWASYSYGSGEQVESYGLLGSDERGEPRIITIEEAYQIIFDDWTKGENNGL